MTSIQRKQALFTLFDTDFFSSLTKDYKGYLVDLATKKSQAISEYQGLISKPDDVYFKEGYVYPFKNDIQKFDPKYLGDLIIIQEVILRTLIVKALRFQSFQDFHFSSLLPMESKKYLSSAISIVLRYKRLHDIFFRASAIQEFKAELFTLERLGFGEKKDIRKEYPIPTVAQMETLVKYSLDTPFCLNIILGNNGLSQFGSLGETLESKRKTPYKPAPGNKIFLGIKKKKNVYLLENGKIVNSRGIEFDVIGLTADVFEKSIIDNRKEEPNEATLNITKAKSIFDNAMDFFVHRYAGNEYLPTSDHWELKWDFQDEQLHTLFGFKFSTKLPDKIQPCPCANKTRKRRQIIELPASGQTTKTNVKINGGKTQKK